MTDRQMERKTFPAFVTKVDDEQGIIEAFFAVFGNVDEGDDVVHPGAFTKTFTERGHKVKVLDNHQTDSIMRVIGKPLVLAEVGRDQLPPEILVKSPEVTGGAFAKIQMLMDTPEGQGAFSRLKSGAVDEWSFGYDTLDYDYNKVDRNGTEVTIRNLRTIKLYEISPVLWGMNPATTTTSAKAQPSEGKPWDVFPVAGEFCVFRIDEEGSRMGEALGCHETESAARQQVEALYASEQAGGEDSDEEKAITAEDKRVLQSELRGLSMTDLVATHRRLHNMAAQGNMLTGFTRADMNWFHAATETELRRRAENEDREPAEPSPLEWAAGEGAEETAGEDDEKHMPGRIAVIRRREEGKGAAIARHVDTGELMFVWIDEEGKHHKITEGEIKSLKEEGKAIYVPTNKTINLSNRIRDVITTFYARYPDSRNNVYWVEEVWDEFLLVKQETPAGNSLWKVSYSINDNIIQFAPPKEWIEGVMIFTPLSIIERHSKARPSSGEETPTSEGDGPEDKATPTDEEMLKLIEIELELTKTLEV